MGDMDDSGRSERLIKAKESWAKTRRDSGREVDGEEAAHDRLPPGKHVVNPWPVLDLGLKPEIAQADWRLAVTGFVAKPLVWTWEDFLKEATFRSVSDFHCVTTWSTFDNEWQGVAFKRLIELVQPLSLAKFVLFTSYDDYTTN